jgi:hypothetical protein
MFFFIQNFRIGSDAAGDPDAIDFHAVFFHSVYYQLGIAAIKEALSGCRDAKP